MIILKVLKWGNVFSYGPNNQIDFSASSLTQLLGRNGHGKSSIPLILEEVLYNKNSKGVKKADIINRYSKDKSYSIELSLEKDGCAYTIKTVRGSTQTIKLYKDGIDISSHTSTATYKQIEEIMGMDHKTFSQIVYQSSVSSLEFLTATDTARKKFLIDLLDLGMYTKALDVFKEVASGLSKEIDKLDARKSTTESWLAKYNPNDMVELDVQEVPVFNSSLTTQLAELKQSLANIASINKKRNTNKLYKQELDSISFSNDLTTQYTQDQVTQLSQKVATNTSMVTRIRADIAKYLKLEGACPTCGHEVAEGHFSKEIAELEKERDTLTVENTELNSQINKVKVELKQVKDNNELKAEWEKYHSLYDPSITAELLVESEVKESIFDLEAEIRAIETKIKSVAEQNAKATAHNAKIKVLQEQKEEMTKELTTVNAELSTRVEKLSTIQVLVKTFGNSGLIAYKIECLVKDLEKLTNEYLAELYAGRFQLSFQVSSSDKLNVIITDNGRDVDILALSSGERARVNVATLLAIRKLMQSLSNSRINLLILDETISNLDTDGKDKLIEVLLAEECLNTFIVSHDYSHPLLEKVTVIKENNISRIE